MGVPTVDQDQADSATHDDTASYFRFLGVVCLTLRLSAARCFFAISRVRWVLSGAQPLERLTSTVLPRILYGIVYWLPLSPKISWPVRRSLLSSSR